MSRTAHKLMAASGATEDAYEIEQSLMFDAVDDPALTITHGSDGNRRTFTYSLWAKVTVPGAHVRLIASWNSNDDSGWFDLNWDANGRVLLQNWTENARTVGMHRDPAAWYHIVLAVDTTQSSGWDRWKVYVNGEQQTLEVVSGSGYPDLNQQTAVSLAASEHSIGSLLNGGTHYDHLDGYLAEVHIIDGTALNASHFGEAHETTGQWIPKEYDTDSAAYGTNGSYLKFESGALGTDSSGEGNNWTAVNLANSDVLLDTPNNSFATLNPLYIFGTTAPSLSQGDLKFTGHGSQYKTAQATIGVKTGAWYWETYFGSSGDITGFVGIIRGTGAGNGSTYPGNDYDNDKVYGYSYQSGGIIRGAAGVGATEGETLATGQTTYAAGDIIGCAVDIPNGNLKFYKNGTEIASGQTVTGISDDYEWMPAVANYASIEHAICNFGQNGTFTGAITAGGNSDANGIGDFKYSVPSGYLALCTKNLATPTIKVPEEHFNPVIYTGDAGARAIAVGFQPDFVWTKNRSSTWSHLLQDSVRGATKELRTNDIVVENTEAQSITAFSSTGYSLGTLNDYNANTHTFVSWNWKAGGAAPTKTYVVKVVSDSGNKFRFDDFGASAQTLDLQEGGTYTFDQADSSNSGHPFVFGTSANATDYTTGVTTTGTPGNAGAKTVITVAASAPALYYTCSNHSGMGGAVNTNTTFGSSYFDGTIKSKTSANTTSGFSIVKYEGTGSAATVAHGLGVAPDLIIVKSTTSAQSWLVYQSAVGVSGGSDPETDYLFLNATDALTDDNSAWNDTAPTSTVFSIGESWASNKSTETYMGYCWANVEGYSKVGSYTGNGNADGAFVYTGFRTAYVLAKRTDSASSWYLYDNKRPPYNQSINPLYPNGNYDEGSNAAYAVDLLSNGFKWRNADGSGMNVSSATYIYLAFAEFPFKYANSR